MSLVSADGQNVDQKAVALQVVDSNTIGLAGAAIYGQSAPDVFTPVGVSGGGALAVAMGAVPTGGATSALQAIGNTSLATIATNTPTLVSGRQPIDGSGVTQPISAASLPLPSGASTSALQTTANMSLAAIAASVASMDTKLNNLSAGAASATAIAAGATGPTVIKAAAGRLVSVLVTTLGAGVMLFYDNATTTSGTIIGAVAASLPVGSVVTLNSPASAGITASGGATMPGVTILFS